MQIEAVQELQELIMINSHFMEQNLQVVKLKIGKVEFDWQGGSSQHFLSEAKATIQFLERSIEELNALGIHLNCEINQWIETDRH